MGGVVRSISSVLDKVIPNEIKPALPFAAAAFPFLAPEVFAGIGSLGGMITNPIAQRAVAGGITNLLSQASQEGFDKRGINPMSFGIGTVGGALTAPSDSFANLKTIGTDALGNTIRFGDLPSAGYADVMGGFEPTNIPYQGPVPLPEGATTNISALDKIQNSILGGARTASDFFNKGVQGLEKEGILNTDFLKAYAPGAVGAASDLAYNAAKDAQLKYLENQKALYGQVQTNKQEQIDYIRSAMQTAGFTSPEIDDALKRSGFAYGGRAGYAEGDIVVNPDPLSPEQIMLRQMKSYYDQQKEQEHYERMQKEQQKAYEDYISRQQALTQSQMMPNTQMMPNNPYDNRAGYGLGGDVLKALGELSSNIKYGGGFKKGVARTYENVKKPILDRISRFRDDIDIKIDNYDYAEDAGESYDIIVKPKTKKGEKIMNQLTIENPYGKDEYGIYGIQKEGNRYYLPQGDTATHYLDEALSRGARASGVTTNLGEFYRTKDIYKTSRDPYGNTLYNPEQDVYDALSRYQKKAEGGLMSLGGREMDFRDGGGFVPIGAKERADDVPARLSKNEFVFTAKAVRNAGGGDIKEGARRMYQIMKQLEAK